MCFVSWDKAHFFHLNESYSFFQVNISVSIGKMENKIEILYLNEQH